MNHFQNFTAGKFIFPANNVAEYNEIYGSDPRKRKQEEKFRKKTNKNTPFNTIHESSEHNIDCNTKSVKKKSSRGLNGVAEEKKKTKKPDKKIQKQENPTEKNPKKTNYFSITETKLANVKAADKSTPPKKTDYASDTLNNRNSSGVHETQPRPIITEPRKAPLNSLFTLQKASTESAKKFKKSDVAIKSKGSLHAGVPSLSQKTSEKISDKSSEALANAPDPGKKPINEILKNHAQKVQPSPVKVFPVKEYSFQGVTELLRKIQNAATSASCAKDEKEPATALKTETTCDEAKLVDIKAKILGKGVIKEIKTEDGSEEKKKAISPWLKFPQSNELERRLRSSWEEPASLFPDDKDIKSGESSEDDKKIKKSESSAQEEEKKIERRTTYTDRLLLLKMLGKELEDKKADAQTKEATKDSKIASEVLKKTDPISLNRQLADVPIKEVTLTENKDTVFIKEFKEPRDGKHHEPEHMIKTKQTKSTELRDMVTQAIKEHKIFCIFDNHSYIVRPVREELLLRGWLEVIPDRRLIPRRRPPPMGPTFERDKAASDRNCNTLEAILTAKETFADELQETVAKSSSLKWTLDKPKALPVASPNNVNKKASEESLNEAVSQFRIIPPTTEKKKNNLEIREFTAKYKAIIAREFERDKEIKKLREKEKHAKALKEKSRSSEQPKTNSHEKTEKIMIVDQVILPGSKSFQEILNSIKENKKTIIQAAAEIKNLDDKADTKVELGFLFDSAAAGNKELPSLGIPKTQDKMVGTTLDKSSYSNSKGIYTESEARTISKIIQSLNARIHFMWLSIKPAIHLKCFNYSPEIVNKFQRTTFCTKIGLWSHLNNIQWYAHEVHYPAKSPRMYNTGEADDLQAFFEDFQMTACIGMLKWLSDTFFERGLKAVQTKKGKVPLKAFEFAIKQCERYVRFKENEDLSVLDDTRVNSEEWDTFLQWFYIITNDHGKIQESSSAQLMVVYTKAVETLKVMKRHWPEIDIDGRLNIWIMKPYCASCGRGIFMTNNVYYIGQHSKYIVQKYIERPLLIYNTKFDIRQWFMITKLTPLEIWMYKECYLRFCTQPFALRNLHESVHLSNNSVQRKYISFRDPTLPDQNMWDSNTFQLYLKTIGQPNAWGEIIYPGMKDAIVSTMLAAQDTFDGPRKSWFEVYGADFMLSSNLKEGPWLIEINENPAMDPSTKVTARLCPQMLRDVIKVVVDKRSNKNASTGQWELIYRQNYSPSFGSVDLDVRGKKIARVPHAKPASSNSHHPSSSPVNLKRVSTNDVEADKLYEFVKSYERRQNSRGDAVDFGRLRGKAKKTRKSTSTRISTSPLTGSNELVSTYDIPLQVMKSDKGTGTQVQYNFQAEKYKFTKFYNV